MVAVPDVGLVVFGGLPVGQPGFTNALWVCDPAVGIGSSDEASRPGADAPGSAWRIAGAAVTGLLIVRTQVELLIWVVFCQVRMKGL